MPYILHPYYTFNKFNRQTQKNRCNYSWLEQTSNSFYFKYFVIDGGDVTNQFKFSKHAINLMMQ